MPWRVTHACRRSFRRRILALCRYPEVRVRNDEAAIRFGAFRLIPARRELIRDGVDVPLGGRAMDLLLHLTANAGSIVSKDQLMRAVWPGRVVEENNLTVHMTAPRRALGEAVGGETTGGPRLIQTVTGRGYLVTGVNMAAQPEPRAGPPTPTITAPKLRRWSG